MKLYIIIALIALASLGVAGSQPFTSAVATSINPAPAAALPRSTPESQGVSSSTIQNFIETADKNIDSLHSVVIVRHGHVIAEGWWAPYGADIPHSMFSLSKSFTSTAVGLAISEGKFSLDDEILKFFPEDAPAEPGNFLKAMRVRDLLRMATGHETEPPRPSDQSWKKAFLSHPVRFKPGTHFVYNTQATYMLSAIVEKTTGMSLLDYLRPRIFDPLGIANPTWDKSPEGITAGGFGLNIRTEDIARFGQLYLQKGKWQGKQLVPEAWVEAATSLQVSNGSNPKSDWDQGYGYQFWRCRNGAFRGDGAHGQFCVVLPKQDTVVAITSGVRDLQSVLNLVWDKLLPGLTDNALPADAAGNEKLARTLKSLSLRQIEATGNPSKALDTISSQKYNFPANPQKLESVAIENKGTDSTTLSVRFNGVESRIECGHNAWKKGTGAWGPQKAQPVAASGEWTGSDTFTARICFYQTPFIYTVSLKFAGDQLRFNNEPNVGNANGQELVGTLAKP